MKKRHVCSFETFSTIWRGEKTRDEYQFYVDQANNFNIKYDQMAEVLKTIEPMLSEEQLEALAFFDIEIRTDLETQYRD